MSDLVKAFTLTILLSCTALSSVLIPLQHFAAAQIGPQSSSSGGAGPSLGSSTAITALQYKNPTHTFEISYPANWRELSLNGIQGKIVGFFGPINNWPEVSISVLQTNESVGSFVKNLANSSQSSGHIGQTTLSGLPALFFTSSSISQCRTATTTTINPSGRICSPADVGTIAVVHQGQAYIIRYLTPNTKVEQTYSPTFLQMLKSFKITQSLRSPPPSGTNTPSPFSGLSP